MALHLAPTVRNEFAKRLRALRAERGYERARHFAKALGIEENRYTRYERAEVEPSLTLIQAICQKLGVTPNELLGVGEPTLDMKQAPVVAAATEPSTSGAELKALAWQLATEAAQVKAESAGRGKPGSDPLGVVRDTGRLYSRLEQDPFGTVTEIVGDPALQDLSAERKVKLAALIEAYTAGMSAPPE